MTHVFFFFLRISNIMLRLRKTNKIGPLHRQIDIRSCSNLGFLLLKDFTIVSNSISCIGKVCRNARELICLRFLHYLTSQ